MRFVLVTLDPGILAPEEQETVIRAIQQAGPHRHLAGNITWLMATPFPPKMVEEVLTQLVTRQEGIFFADLYTTPALLNIGWEEGEAA